MSIFVILPRHLSDLVRNRQKTAINSIPSISFFCGVWEILIYPKRNSESTNFEYFENGFIGCVGTPVIINNYDFHNIYENFNENSIGEICDLLGGHYVLLVCKNNNLYVIEDGIGSLDVFYGINSYPIISNDLSFSSLNVTLLEDQEISEIDSVNLNSGPSTVIPGVNKLIGGVEYLKILANGSLQVASHGNTIGERIRKLEGCDEINYFLRVRNIFKDICNKYPCIGLNFTGGLDGRTILASILDLGAHVEFYYGKGNSQIINTQEKDFQISSQIARDLNITQHIMDWQITDSDLQDEIVYKNYKLLGLSARVHGGSKAFIQSLIDRNKEGREIIFMGGFCPGFSNKDFHETEYTTFQDVVIDCLKGPLESVGFRNYKKVFNRFYQDCRAYCLAHNLIDSDDNMLFKGHIIRTLLYIRPESEHLQLFNRFDNYIAPYNTNELLIPMLAMDASIRKGRKLQLHIIHKCRPELLDYHLFSGIADRQISDKLEIDTKKVVKKSFRIPIKYLAYRYYIFKMPFSKKYVGQDFKIYSGILDEMNQNYKSRWFGFTIFNLRYCLRLRFSYRIKSYQEMLNCESKV